MIKVRFCRYDILKQINAIELNQIRKFDPASDVSIGFPRYMYKMGVHMEWRKMIKENGGTEKDLARRPEERG